MKQCESCNDGNAVYGERYCTHCRKAILKKLDEEGYLEKKPKRAMARTEELDRKSIVSFEALGGTAEMNGSGDQW